MTELLLPTLGRLRSDGEGDLWQRVRRLGSGAVSVRLIEEWERPAGF